MPEESLLTEQEREDVSRLFGSPFFIPPKFKDWLGDQIALNIPQIPFGQFFGGRGVERQVDVSTDSVSASGAGTTTLYSSKVKARQLGANGRLLLDLYFTAQSPDSSNWVDIAFLLGGTQVGALQITVGDLDGTARPGVVHLELMNVDSPSVQGGSFSAVMLNSSDGYTRWEGAIDGTVDTTVDNDLEVTAAWYAGSADDVVKKTQALLNVYTPLL